MADWSLLQPAPNMFGSIAAGYQAGQALGKQKRLDAALQGVDFNNPQTFLPVISADPANGAALLGAGVKMAEFTRDANRGKTLGDLLRMRAGLPSPNSSAPGAVLATDPVTGNNGSYHPDDIPALTATPTAPALTGMSPQSTAAPDAGNPQAMPSPSAAGAAPALGGNIQVPGRAALSGNQSSAPQPAPIASAPDASAATAPSAAPGDASAPSQDPTPAPIVVTARTPHEDAQQKYAIAMANMAQYSSPEQMVQVADLFSKMDESQTKTLADAANAFSVVGMTAQTLPYDQRKAYIAAHRNDLLLHHVQPEQIDGFDPTDQNLAYVTNQALGTKDALEAKSRADSFAETARHNQVDEGQGQQRIGIEAQNAATSAGQLGVARGNLGVAEARLGITKQGAAAVTPAKVIGPILAKMASGQPLTAAEKQTFATYRQIDPLKEMMRQALPSGDDGDDGSVTVAPPPVQAAPSPRPVAGPKVGQTAVNPRTGHRVTWNGKTWVG